MTKRDGDKLRAFQAELREMIEAYGPDSTTGEAAAKLRDACALALLGRAFTVREVSPSTGRIIPTHRHEKFDGQGGS